MQTGQLLAIYVDALGTLQRQTEQLQAQYADQMQCRRGCAGCCRDGFTIREIEALYLLEGFNALPEETQQLICQNLESPSEKCPLLVDEACSLYRNRPVLCRAYGLMIQLKETISTCPLNFTDHQAQKLSVLDIAPYYELLDELSERLPSQSKPAAKASIRDMLRRHLSIA